MNTWQIQEAKQRFSEVIRSAKYEGPQQITYRGKEDAWILSAEDYRALRKKRSNLIELFQSSPKNVHLKITRKKDKPRKIVL